jgi:hypothetical protein
MPSTYTPIATQTLGSASSTVTFSSIPATYTDLIIILNGQSTTGTPEIITRFNSDTGSNYSRTFVLGDGSLTSSGRSTSQTYFAPASIETGNTIIIFNIMNYSNTTTNKTAICRATLPAQIAAATVGLWQSTAAINTIAISTASSTFVAGSTFTLYGIKAA